MYITLRNDNGDDVVLFGASDFQVFGDSVVVFWPPSSNVDEQEDEFEGWNVVGAVEESSMDVQGLVDSIVDEAMAGSEVKAVLSDNNLMLHDAVEEVESIDDVDLDDVEIVR
jgi:hypothetical protein